MIDILIIDDDEVFGDLTVERFENTPWRAEFHQGPFGTMNAIRSRQPKVVIMDVNMPGLDGTRISELIRKTPGLSHMRVLLHSSLDARELAALAQQHGIDAALPKSASREEFLSKVESLLASVERRLGPR